VLPRAKSGCWDRLIGSIVLQVRSGRRHRYDGYEGTQFSLTPRRHLSRRTRSEGQFLSPIGGAASTSPSSGNWSRTSTLPLGAPVLIPRGLFQARTDPFLRGFALGEATHGGRGRPALFEVVCGLRSARVSARPFQPEQDQVALRSRNLQELLRSDRGDVHRGRPRVGRGAVRGFHHGQGQRCQSSPEIPKNSPC
jgi:hypothetical protein